MRWTTRDIQVTAERAAVFEFPAVLLLVAALVGAALFLVAWWRGQDGPDDE